MQEEARDIDSLKAELDQRMRELVGDTSDRAPRRAEAGQTESIQHRPTKPEIEVRELRPGIPPEDRPFPTLEEVERRYIVSVLENHNWRISGPKGAARILGLNPSTLRSRMKKLGISRYISRNREI